MTTGPQPPLRLVRRGAAQALARRSTACSGLCITKLDVLDGLKELQLCTGYKLDGEYTDILPLGADDIDALQAGLRDAGRLERQHGGRHAVRQAAGQCARLYLQRIEQVDGVPIHHDLDQPRPRPSLIMMRHPYLAD